MDELDVFPPYYYEEDINVLILAEAMREGKIVCIIPHSDFNGKKGSAMYGFVSDMTKGGVALIRFQVLPNGDMIHYKKGVNFQDIHSAESDVQLDGDWTIRVQDYVKNLKKMQENMESKELNNTLAEDILIAFSSLYAETIVSENKLLTLNEFTDDSQDKENELSEEELSMIDENGNIKSVDIIGDNQYD